jgi:hypothetical protein
MHWLNAKYGLDIDNTSLTSVAWPPAFPAQWRKYPGYTLTQQATARANGAIIDFAHVKPGDRLYYDKPGEHHVVMYIGNGKVVHAAGHAYGVIVSPVVPPGQVGHGGKTLTCVVSATVHARKCGLHFDAPVVAKPTIPTPKPPVSLPVVSIGHVLTAIAKDGPAKQGHVTYPVEVKLVERALDKLNYLAASRVDGSAGTSTFGKGSAYQKLQIHLGYSGSDADGIPGSRSLRWLGEHSGLFRTR